MKKTFDTGDALSKHGDRKQTDSVYIMYAKSKDKNPPPPKTCNKLQNSNLEMSGLVGAFFSKREGQKLGRGVWVCNEIGLLAGFAHIILD